MTNKHTFIQFNYGGHYSEDYEWIPKNASRGVMVKPSKLTYSELVEKICKKIGKEVTSMKVKLSYVVCKSERETSIVDDEDIVGYLTVVDKDGRRPHLYVELEGEREECERVEKLSRVEGRSSIGVNYEEPMDVNNGGVLTIFGGHIVEPIIEEANEASVEQSMEIAVIKDREHGVSRMDNEEDNGLDSRIEYYELPSAGEGIQRSQSIDEWEDGTGIELNQEFVSKEALQDLVNRAANKYPCVHAIAAARNFVGSDWRTDSLDMEELSSAYYYMNTWALAYIRTIFPVPHASDWTIPDEIKELCVLPPEKTSKPGRNQEPRFPSTGEHRRKKTNNKFQRGIDINGWLQPEILDPNHAQEEAQEENNE